jgi:hypothetical protein
MRKSLWAIALLFVAIGAPAARAGSVKWTFSGASATFSDPYPAGTDTITGSFLFNSATGYQSHLSITLTGPVFPGTYTLVAPSLDSSLGAVLGYHGANYIGITFVDLFTSLSPDPLYAITIYDTTTSSTIAYTDTNFCTGCVTGFAVPTTAATPEPSSLLLFGTSLLGLAPFRRKLFGR